jgi:sterol desaturase/sphingolipid hydroxylase (fatty acid hydroxylase superfamily)
MEQDRAANAAFITSVQPLATGARTPVSQDAASHSSDAAPTMPTPIKNTVFNFVPPATLVAIVCFWMLAPAAWTQNGWSIVIASTLTALFVQGLEVLHERHTGWRITGRELATDLFYVILGNTAIAWCTTTLAEEPLKAAKHALGIATPWAMHMPFLAQVALVIFLVEFGQYWMHRAMHNTLLWYPHAPHHHITQLNAMKGYVGNPLELFLISLSVVALFDLPVAAEFCAFNLLGAISIFAHANVRADPPRWYGFFFTTIRHHSLHHTALSYEDTRCNYANSLILLDRVFGTYREGESSIVGQDDRKRLSIWEQTVFPARPVIERIKQKRAASTNG